MELLDTLRRRQGGVSQTAEIACGELGMLTVQGLSPQELSGLGSDPRAVLYAACRDLQRCGEQLRQEGRLFTPDQVMQFVSDGEAAAGAAAVAALSRGGDTAPLSGAFPDRTQTRWRAAAGTDGNAPSGGMEEREAAGSLHWTAEMEDRSAADADRMNREAGGAWSAAGIPADGQPVSGEAEPGGTEAAAVRETGLQKIRLGTVHGFWNRFRKVRQNFVQRSEMKNSGAGLSPEAEEIRPGTVQAFWTQDSEIRPESVQGNFQQDGGDEAAGAAPIDSFGQVSHEFVEETGTAPQPGGKVPHFAEDGGNRTQNLVETPKSRVLRPTSAEAFPHGAGGFLHTGAAGLHENESSLHEMESEAGEKQEKGLHETTSFLHEISSEISSGEGPAAHEIKSEPSRGEERGPHEMKSFLHENESEFTEAAGVGLHESKLSLHENKSEVSRNRGHRLHEITSFSHEAASEFPSIFPGGTHETKSLLHEIPSELPEWAEEGLHELPSGLHESESESAQRLAKALLEGLRRARETR